MLPARVFDIAALPAPSWGRRARDGGEGGSARAGASESSALLARRPPGLGAASALSAPLYQKRGRGARLRVSLEDFLEKLPRPS